MRTIGLLIVSNLFMTVAWYGHLRYKHVDLWKVIMVSWLIASMEYCFQVPANRWGYWVFNAFQLKIIQEIISLVIFVGFSIYYLRESPSWNHLVSLALILGAVYFAFLPSSPVS